MNIWIDSCLNEAPPPCDEVLLPTVKGSEASNLRAPGTCVLLVTGPTTVFVPFDFVPTT